MYQIAITQKPSGWAYWLLNLCVIYIPVLIGYFIQKWHKGWRWLVILFMNYTKDDVDWLFYSLITQRLTLIGCFIDNDKNTAVDCLFFRPWYKDCCWFIASFILLLIGYFIHADKNDSCFTVSFTCDTNVLTLLLVSYFNHP